MPPSNATYVPQRGDIIWLDFDPQAGHEQGRRRPALVLSYQVYNLPSGLGLFCPITSKVKGYPFEVVLPEGLPVSGAVLADQVRNLDWRARRATLIGQMPQPITEDVVAKFRTLFE